MSDCPNSLKYGELQIGEDTASSDVGQKFAAAMAGASSHRASAVSAIAALVSMCGGLKGGGSGAPSASGCISSRSVTCDAAPVVSVDTGGEPTIEGLEVFPVPTITIPTYTIIAPDISDLGYSEATYQSDIQDLLKTALVGFIEDGGTGINPDVEVSLWERSRERQAAVKNRLQNEANNYTLSRGYCLPVCISTGLLSEAIAEQDRSDQQLESEILIEKAKLARSQVDYALQAGLTLEEQEKKHFNDVANRTLDCAKASVQVIIDLYFAKIDAYIAQVESSKATVDIAKVQADIVISKNKNVIDTYKARIEAYRVKLLAEIGIVETIVKIYGFEVMGFEAEEKAAILSLKAQVKEQQGEVVNAKNSAALSLKDAEMTIQESLGKLQLSTAKGLASGRLNAQWLAGMLGINSVSARVATNVSRTASNADSTTATRSKQSSYSTIHRYDHTS